MILPYLHLAVDLCVLDPSRGSMFLTGDGFLAGSVYDTSRSYVLSSFMTMCDTTSTHPITTGKHMRAQRAREEGRGGLSLCFARPCFPPQFGGERSFATADANRRGQASLQNQDNTSIQPPTLFGRSFYAVVRLHTNDSPCHPDSAEAVSSTIFRLPGCLSFSRSVHNISFPRMPIFQPRAHAIGMYFHVYLWEEETHKREGALLSQRGEEGHEQPKLILVGPLLLHLLQKIVAHLRVRERVRGLMEQTQRRTGSKSWAGRGHEKSPRASKCPVVTQRWHDAHARLAQHLTRL